MLEYDIDIVVDEYIVRTLCISKVILFKNFIYVKESVEITFGFC